MKGSGQRQTELTVLDSFVLLDMDRTLLDSDAKVRLQCELLVECGVSKADADLALATVIASTGTGYSESVLLEQLFGPSVMQKVHELMLARAASDKTFRSQLLYDGATLRLIKALRDRGYVMGIFTNGEVVNQQYKIELLRVALGETEETLPAMVTNESEKAMHVGDWIDYRSGLIEIPQQLTAGGQMQARHLVLIDDKRKNLVAHKNHHFIRGILVDNRVSGRAGLTTANDVAAQLEQNVPLLEISRHYGA